MKPVVKYAVWALIAGAIVFAGVKGYKLYQAKQAAKAAAAA
jgi:hypothetical protein